MHALRYDVYAITLHASAALRALCDHISCTCCAMTAWAVNMQCLNAIALLARCAMRCSMEPPPPRKGAAEKRRETDARACACFGGWTASASEARVVAGLSEPSGRGAPRGLVGRQFSRGEMRAGHLRRGGLLTFLVGLDVAGSE
jgi:hypothetical protein